jgi:hypothetical protein
MRQKRYYVVISLLLMTYAMYHEHTLSLRKP